ncbi:hypothetical protein GOV06_05900 [Candidatus Woesearchaeota archaeon]|nr:hypothetical protein [Candidatus Woesearchaeota archaeon]
MAKKVETCACPVCDAGLCKGCSLVALVIGILYLLKDIAVVDYTFGIQWYTVGFLMVGAGFLLALKK